MDGANGQDDSRRRQEEDRNIVGTHSDDAQALAAQPGEASAGADAG